MTESGDGDTSTGGQEPQVPVWSVDRLVQTITGGMPARKADWDHFANETDDAAWSHQSILESYRSIRERSAVERSFGSHIVFGVRRLGKTALLWQIHPTPPANAIFAYVDVDSVVDASNAFDRCPAAFPLRWLTSDT